MDIIVGYSCNSSVGLRRRIGFFCNEKNIHLLRFERNSSVSYDFVVCTCSGDLLGVLEYARKGGKVVFDYVDDMLSIRDLSIHNYFTILFRFFVGRSTFRFVTYKTLLLDLIKISTCCTCSNSTVVSQLKKLNRNVFCVWDNMYDIHTSDSPLQWDRRKDEILSSVRIGWEGLPSNFKHLLIVRKALIELQKEYDVEILIFSKVKSWRDRIYYLMLYIFYLRGVCFQFDEWNISSIATKLLTCDICIIPLDACDPVAQGKPVNKYFGILLLGIPVLVSPIQSYVALSSSAKDPFFVHDEKDWYIKISKLLFDLSFRRDVSVIQNEIAQGLPTKNQLLEAWFDVFKFVGIKEF